MPNDEAALKVAVAGTNIGSMLHVRALKAAGLEVVALVGRDRDRTQQRARHFSIPAASTSIAEVLDSDVDAIVIATPPATHHPIALSAIAAGKHVLCEKPLATSADLAREMRDAAGEAGVVALLEHPGRWAVNFALLRRIVRDGVLGDLIQGTFNFDSPMTHLPQPLDVPDWWRTAETGGGWLRNWNTHGIDLIRYMIGEFAAVSGTVHPDPARGMSADDAYAFSFVLAEGMQGTMSGTCRAWDTYVHSRVTGGAATATIAIGSPVVIADIDGRREVEPPQDLLDSIGLGFPRDSVPAERIPQPNSGVYYDVHANDRSFVEQVSIYTAFRRRIADRTYRHPAMADFGDGVAGLEVVEAVERSGREGRWVELAS